MAVCIALLCLFLRRPTTARAYRDRGCRSLCERNFGGEYRAGFFPNIVEYGNDDRGKLGGFHTGLFMHVQVSMYTYGDGWPGKGIMSLRVLTPHL